MAVAEILRTELPSLVLWYVINMNCLIGELSSCQVPSSIKKLPKNLTAVGKPIFKTLLNGMFSIMYKVVLHVTQRFIAAISHLKGENVELDIPSLSTEKLSEVSSLVYGFVVITN